MFGDAARMYLQKEVTLATYVAAMLGTVPSTKEVLDYVHEHAEEINANLKGEIRTTRILISPTLCWAVREMTFCSGRAAMTC